MQPKALNVPFLLVYFSSNTLLQLLLCESSIAWSWLTKAEVFVSEVVIIFSEKQIQ